jgi:DNA-binding NtrC family response regulator
MGIVGESERVWLLRLAIARAAERGIPVLVVGETGTGKELVARGIHAKSGFARGPFIAANCASLRGELAALELFGGPKGWPNPGTPETIGYFETAGIGVLFLDEIGEVDGNVQSLLLRAIEHGFSRKGDPRVRPVRCLVIVATNRGEAGLKHDVNYRFQSVIATPSLAQRREDIALIVPHLLREIAPALLKSDANGRPYAPVHASLMAGLLRHELDGNVRGMGRILEKAVDHIAGDGLLRWPLGVPVPDVAPLVLRKEPRHYTADELLEGIGAKPTQRPPPDLSTDRVSADPRETFGQRPDPSRELLLETLQRTGWNKTKTAQILGIRRERVYLLTQKYGIERPT